jgi:hypothetical protein
MDRGELQRLRLGSKLSTIPILSLNFEQIGE